jgi:flagellar M-ring protein FliF
MSDFFKQLLTQLKAIWSRFNTMQKALLVAAFSITFIGLLAAVSISGLGKAGDGHVTLFANLGIEEASQITLYLQEAKHPYKLENDGRTIVVPKDMVHEIRMELARNGLPQNGNKGYELFDANQLGMTDFVQKLNFRRAIETELQRSIETFREVEQARVHITQPKETIFMDKKEEATASVIVKIRPGEEIKEKQIRGITHLVASSVEGLVARQVAILDDNGNLLTKGFADNAVAEHTDHNLEMQRSVEKHMELKIAHILEGVLGPNKARIKVSAELDFDQINKTVENYDPKSKVVRSEQRDDQTRQNSPAIGDETTEGSITNYEVNRSVAQIIAAPGTTKRLSVSAAVDGMYEAGEDDEKIYKPRAQEELAVLTQLVQKAVGYNPNRGDEVYVASVQFDRSHLEKEIQAMKDMRQAEIVQVWSLRVTIILIVILAFVFLRKIAMGITEAMNPPIPKYAGIDLDYEDEEIPESVMRQNEMLEKIENLTMDNPENVVAIIRNWLNEEVDRKSAKK